MPRSRLAVIAAIALVVAGGVWFATRSSSTSARNPADSAGSSTRTPAQAHMRGSAAPGWIAQPGAGARRVAGRVTYARAPAAGATVTLTSPLTDSGLVPPVTLTTGADGRFDLGPQDAARIAVAAAMPGKTAAVLDLDLRDPTLRPAADAIELVLRDCAASVYGSVLDAGGGPIPGAQVRRGPVAAIAADDGAFELCVPVGDTALKVAADGYGTIAVVVSAFARLHRDFRLSPEAVIGGRTVRDDRSPVAGAVVHLAATPGFGGMSEVPAAAAQTTSDSDGRFRFTGVAAGRRQLTAATDGLRTSGGTDVAVEPGASGDEEVVLTLAPAVAVGGTVVDEADKPVAGATVSIALGDDPMRGESATALSQADGTFVVDGVTPGAHDVRVAPYRLADRGTNRRVTVPLTGVVDLELTVVRGSSVSGVVTRRGRPVEGAQVSLRDRGRTTTITDGSFVLRGVVPGDHRLYAESLEDGAFTRGPTVTASAGADITGLAIELDLAGAISGVVVDQNGAPVPSVFLAFSLVGGSDLGQSTTAVDGAFVVRALSGGGDYRVDITASPRSSQRFAPATGDELPPVSVPDGNAQIQGVRYAIRVDRLSIAGRVVDDQGNPVPDVRVEARPTGRGFVMEPASDVTGVDGAFAITNLLAGAYHVAARAGGGAESAPSEVDAGTRGLRLVLAAPGEIEGTLAGFAAPPRVVARAKGGRTRRVRMAGIARGDASAAVQGTTFRVRGLTPGRYRVIALIDGIAGDEVEVVVSSRATARATLTYRGVGSLSGIVTDAATRAPVRGARCALPSARRNDIGTDGQGRFTIDPAPVGRATVMCWSETGKSGQAEAEVAAGQQATVAISLAEYKAPAPLSTMGATFTSSTAGPRVATVTPGGPAATAGVKVDDVVTALEGWDYIPIAELDGEMMARLVTYQPPGTVVKLKLKRGSTTVDASVTLAAP